MSSNGSLEQAIVQFATIIIPLGQELGGPSPNLAAATLAHPVKSFFAVCLLNLIIFTVARIALRVLIGALRAVLTGTTMALSSAWDRTLRSLTRGIRLASIRRQRRYRKTRSQDKEPSPGFESWEDFSERLRTEGERDRESSAEKQRALLVLGLSSLASEREIRKAYIRLTKRYHPDHFMQAPETERERLQETTVRIRQAYETLTNQLCSAR